MAREQQITDITDDQIHKEALKQSGVSTARDIKRGVDDQGRHYIEISTPGGKDVIRMYDANESAY
jgi:hypothetical protein